MHTNSEILTAVLVAWAKPMADRIIADIIAGNEGVVAANEWVRKYFPVAANYSIVNDLSFLAVPATELMLTPIVRNGIAKLNIGEDDIPEYAAKIVDSAIAEAKKNNGLTLFNKIEIEKSDLEQLRGMLKRNLPVVASERYEVK